MGSPEKPANSAGEGGQAISPAERFRRLTKELVAVPPAELKEAERVYQAKRESTGKTKEGT
jgi:hypothetical protein